MLAGIGVDAMIMDETDPELKDKIGAGAYVVAAAKALRRLPFRFTVQLDDQRPRRRRSMICAIANVGELQGNFVLVPGASPDDGLLDVFIASPHGVRHWVKLVLRLITGDPRRTTKSTRRRERVRVNLRGEENYQLDGDVVGTGTRLTAEIRPGALTVCVPAPVS